MNKLLLAALSATCFAAASYAAVDPNPSLPSSIPDSTGIMLGKTKLADAVPSASGDYKVAMYLNKDGKNVSGQNEFTVVMYKGNAPDGTIVLVKINTKSDKGDRLGVVHTRKDGVRVVVCPGSKQEALRAMDKPPVKIQPAPSAPAVQPAPVAPAVQPAPIAPAVQPAPVANIPPAPPMPPASNIPAAPPMPPKAATPPPPPPMPPATTTKPAVETKPAKPSGDLVKPGADALQAGASRLKPVQPKSDEEKKQDRLTPEQQKLLDRAKQMNPDDQQEEDNGEW